MSIVLDNIGYIILFSYIHYKDKNDNFTLYKLNDNADNYKKIETNKIKHYNINGVIDVNNNYNSKTILPTDTETNLSEIVNELTKNGKNEVLDLIKPFIDLGFQKQSNQLLGYIDDYSRYIVGMEIYRSQTASNLLEVYR